MTWVIAVVAHLYQMVLVLKMATPQQRSWCVLQSAKKQSVTAVECAFWTQFHMEPPSRASIFFIRCYQTRQWPVKEKNVPVARKVRKISSLVL
jgi:hypothetical protein